MIAAAFRHPTAVLILTPSNDTLYNKWCREVETFQAACAVVPGAFHWLTTVFLGDQNRSGNLINLTEKIRQATRTRPMLIVAKIGVLGAVLHEQDQWRRRALACVFQQFGIGSDERVWWCRQILGSGSLTAVPELRDLRRSSVLWEDTMGYSADLRWAYEQVLRKDGAVAD